jgi:hypothetical protein
MASFLPTEQALIELGQLCFAASAPLGFHAANFLARIDMKALRKFPRGGGPAWPFIMFRALVREAGPCSLMGLSSGLCTVDKPCLKTQCTTQGTFPEP